jgi:F-type H+-transporting ATPase subunit alpha
VSIWVGSNGYLDDVPLEDVGRFESDFLDYVQRNQPGIYQAIRETQQLSDDTAAALKEAVEEFRQTFETTGGGVLAPEDEDEGKPMSGDEVGQETVARRTQPEKPEKKDDGAAAGEPG